ncbi:unnamed protein product [Urochloa decumbens]|uniref:SWIM-type domain-containing protein n=1 Tax=Urochloa decumbens TaxID=240449 RepID=A0ABC9D1G5_9POAL
MTLAVLFDLNSEPQDEGDESALAGGHDQTVLHQSAATSLQSAATSVQSHGDVSDMCGLSAEPPGQHQSAGNMLGQADSGGLTIPTAETSLAGLDVEEGVEVISTPQEPFVGMTFAKPDAAKDYYNSYARHTGFSIRIDTSRESKRTEEKTKYIFVCQRAGVNKKEKVATDGPITEKKIVKQRRRDYVERTHCPARMIVRKTSHAHWEVVHFEKEHNHDRVKKFSLTKYMNSHRNILPEEKEFIRFLHGCNITSTRAFQIMADLYGGIDNCPYTEGDVKNLRVEYRAEYKCKDMKVTLDYFGELQKEDPDFYYSYTLDEEDRVENLFWVDSAARKSYELYGDCISFDATYLTNAYNMSFAPFIGIDRNGITIQLGCGFLRNEKTESYVWLFTEFKKAMGDKDPLNIITDQDLAIKAAIAIVFTTSVHRNCRWHIMENARKMLGPFLNGKEALSEDFKNCVSFSFSPAEFESKWQAMLDKYEINGDDRFEHLYRMRASWVPAYFMQRFFPFLQTTARSEGFNAVLKRYVNPKNSIYNFVQQYKKIQQRIFIKQDLQEAVTVSKVPHYLTGHPMERQMKEVYTRKLFNVFQYELQLSSSYYVVRVDGDNLLDVVPYKNCPEELYGPRTFRVTASTLDGVYSCTCCKFERDGVLCCHILKVFDTLAVREVPERYILPRWSAQILDDDGIEVLGESLQASELSSHGKHIVRYSRLCTKFNNIIRPSIGDDEGYSIVSKHVAAMQAELLEMRKRKASSLPSGMQSGEVGQSSGGGAASKNKKPRKKASMAVLQGDTAEGSAPKGSEGSNPEIRDPPITKRQGRPREKRYKTGLDLLPPKPKPCKYCLSTEHTTSKCQAKPPRKRTQQLADVATKLG